MTRHLLAIRLGPVQEFIAQARRTRDLWFGSDLLSEVSKTVARGLTTDEGAIEGLVFPAPRQLEAGSGFANKIVALVHGEPALLARRARDAARSWLVEQGMEALAGHPELVEPSSHPAAREQLETFLEFHAAWAPCAADSDYPRALEDVEAALAGHKLLHAFPSWERQRGGVHKSSLDGARETILRGGDRSGDRWRRFRIGRREELDAVGLLKRTAPQPEQFVPIPTIGMADWLQRVEELRPELLQALRDECGRRRFTHVQREAAWVQRFPFDAQVLLPDRWSPYFADCGIEDAAEARRFGQRFVRPLLEVPALGEPFPYVACLVADGDHMGRTLRELARIGPVAHRRLSDALSGFAQQARLIVEEGSHRGVLVYAGGDDVLAFVCPVDAARCALALSQAFERAMREALAGSDIVPPTLSVGIGLGHVLESLGELLDLGRRAERAAKDAGRDALALQVTRHSGRELRWSARWTENPVPLLEADVARLARNEPPMKKVHEVAQLLARVPSPDSVSDAAAVDWQRLLARETGRILARSDLGREAPLKPEQTGLTLEADTYRETFHRVRAWTARLEIAAVLTRARAPALASGGAA